MRASPSSITSSRLSDSPSPYRLAATHTGRLPRNRQGVIDQPARLLLTRWWRRAPLLGRVVGFEYLAGDWQSLVQSWVDDAKPDYLALTYPAWQEWMGRRRTRALMRLPPPERTAELAAWARGGIPGPDEAPEAAQALRKAHAKVESILRMHLPVS